MQIEHFLIINVNQYNHIHVNNTVKMEHRQMLMPRKIKNVKFLIVPHLLTMKIRASDFIHILSSTAILSHLIKRFNLSQTRAKYSKALRIWTLLYKDGMSSSISTQKIKHSYVSICAISEWFRVVSPNKVQKSPAHEII